MTTTQTTGRQSCATCGKVRKLVTFSSLEKWGGDPDQCMGCGSGVQHHATPLAKPAQPAEVNWDDWTA